MKKWMKNNFFFKAFIIFAAIAVFIELNYALKESENQNHISKSQNNQVGQISGSIEKTAGKGQGITHLAREALNEYLAENPNINLLPAQKVFIETYFINLYKNKDVAEGEKIEFKKEDIASAIQKALALTPSQIKEWAKYL